MYYLRIEGNTFGFVVDSVHEIKNTDIPTTEESYKKFFEIQAQGKQFKLKGTPTGSTLFDYIEEYVPKAIEAPKSEVEKLKQQVLDLQEIVANIQFEKLAGGM